MQRYRCTTCKKIFTRRDFPHHKCSSGHRVASNTRYTEVTSTSSGSYFSNSSSDWGSSDSYSSSSDSYSTGGLGGDSGGGGASSDW